MFEITTKVENGKVVVFMKRAGVPIDDFRKEFPIEDKKGWQSWHKLALREANRRNAREKRKATRE